MGGWVEGGCVGRIPFRSGFAAATTVVLNYRGREKWHFEEKT